MHGLKNNGLSLALCLLLSSLGARAFGASSCEGGAKLVRTRILSDKDIAWGWVCPEDLANSAPNARGELLSRVPFYRDNEGRPAGNLQFGGTVIGHHNNPAAANAEAKRAVPQVQAPQSANGAQDNVNTKLSTNYNGANSKPIWVSGVDDAIAKYGLNETRIFSGKPSGNFSEENGYRYFVPTVKNQWGMPIEIPGNGTFNFNNQTAIKRPVYSVVPNSNGVGSSLVQVGWAAPELDKDGHVGMRLLSGAKLDQPMVNTQPPAGYKAPETPGPTNSSNVAGADTAVPKVPAAEVPAGYSKGVITDGDGNSLQVMRSDSSGNMYPLGKPDGGNLQLPLDGQYAAGDPGKGSKVLTANEWQNIHPSTDSTPANTSNAAPTTASSKELASAPPSEIAKSNNLPSATLEILGKKGLTEVPGSFVEKAADGSSKAVTSPVYSTPDGSRTFVSSMNGDGSRTWSEVGLKQISLPGGGQTNEIVSQPNSNKTFVTNQLPDSPNAGATPQSPATSDAQTGINSNGEMAGADARNGLLPVKLTGGVYGTQKVDALKNPQTGDVYLKDNFLKHPTSLPGSLDNPSQEISRGVTVIEPTQSTKQPQSTNPFPLPSDPASLNPASVTPVASNSGANANGYGEYPDPPTTGVTPSNGVGPSMSESMPPGARYIHVHGPHGEWGQWVDKSGKEITPPAQGGTTPGTNGATNNLFPGPGNTESPTNQNSTFMPEPNTNTTAPNSNTNNPNAGTDSGTPTGPLSH